jgi:hypothetical protein
MNTEFLVVRLEGERNLRILSHMWGNNFEIYVEKYDMEV